MDHDEEIYYKELHQTARHYDTKLWTVLGVSLVVIGWLATGFDFADFVSIKNILILFTAGVVSHLLLPKFIKEHAHTLWIQKKINAFDDQENKKPQKAQSVQEKLRMRRPFFSLPSRRTLDGMFSTEDMIAELKELKQSRTPYFDRIPGHEKLLQKEVSKWFMWLMRIISWSSFMLLGIILLYALIECRDPNLVFFFECTNEL